VAKYIEQCNNLKSYESVKNKHFSAAQYRAFTIPSFIQHKVPRHWLKLVAENLQELENVTNRVYEG
jgi:hypothetical protein